MEPSEKELLDRLIQELKEAYFLKQPEIRRRTVKWAETAYKNLTKLITNEVRSISLNTVRSIMDGTYNIKPDPRNTGTLDTLSMFLGYKDWNGFLGSYDETNTHEKLDRLLLNVVRDANIEVLNTLRQVPIINTETLSAYFIKDTPYYRTFEYLLNVKIKTGLKLTAESECFVSNLEVRVRLARKVMAVVRETWKLNWRRTDNSIHDESIEQKDFVYILFYNGKSWKIEGKHKINKSFDEVTIPIDLPALELKGLPSLEPRHRWWFRKFFSDYFIEFD